jgi:hypothetical protein
MKKLWRRSMKTSTMICSWWRINKTWKELEPVPVWELTRVLTRWDWMNMTTWRKWGSEENMIEIWLLKWNNTMNMN